MHTAPQRMTTVHLHGHLGRQFGRRFQFAAETPRQALDLLEANFPEFRGVVLSAEHPFRVTVGRSDHRDGRGLRKGLGRARTIHIVPMVGGSNNGPVKMLAGAVLIVAGVLGQTIGKPYGGDAWGPQLMGMGFGMFAGGAAQWLSRGPNMDQRNRDDEGRRSSYVFSGVVNTAAQGGCVPVLYGRLRHGGMLISAGVTAEDILESGRPTSGFRIQTGRYLGISRDDVTSGAVVEFPLAAAGGVAPYSWAIESAGTWATISGSTLRLDCAHMPTTADDARIEVVVTDATMARARATFDPRYDEETPAVSGSSGDSGPSQHVPSESPDSLQSRAVARLLLLLGEGPVMGPVDGLKSVYLDGTPIQNADGTYNFKLLRDPEFRLGIPTQDPLVSWSEIESEQTDGREIKKADPLVLTVSDTATDSLRMTFGVPSLCKSLDNGDLVGTDVVLSVYIQPAGGTWVMHDMVALRGKATSRYQRSARISLRDYGPGPWQIKVVRATDDSDSVGLNNKTVLDSYTLIQEARLTYPNRYILGLTLDASQFQGIPTVGVESNGRIVRVPSNYDPEAKAYSGAWDGTWKLAWTDDPAWCYLDLLTHPRYGLGRYLRLDQIATGQLYQVARYCDGMVSDGRGGTEPRFALNLYLQQAEEAYSVLQHMSAAFRGMSYWGSGSVQVAQDAPADPIMLFTESNVQDGMFNYQSTSRRSRHNAISVGWNDPADAYKIKYEYVSDPQDIAKSGLRQTEEMALGCTSQGQAHRWGLWRLYTERDETEVVAFTAGMEGIGLRPGDLIHIQDQSRVLNRLGGRILASDGTTHTLDSAPQVGPGNYRLWCVLPSGATAAMPCININGATVTTEAFPEVPGEMAQWILQDASQAPRLYRVLSVREGATGSSYDITALIHDPAKYSAIETGWSLPSRPNVPTPAALGPASQLTLSSREVVHDDYVSNVLVASWVAGSGASKYRVDWRRDGGNWTESSASVNSWELPDCVPGVYEVRVTSLDASGAASVAVSKSLNLEGSLRDDWITPSEKPALVQQWTDAQAEKVNLVTMADKAGVDKSAMVAAYNALSAYLSGTSTTGWNVVPGVKVYLGAGGWRTWEQTWAAYRAAADALSRAVLGDAADTVAALASDGIISAGSEKARVALERAKISATYGSLSAQRSALGITGTAWDNYLQAKNDLDTYCGGLTPSLAMTNVDTPVIASMWAGSWAGYYQAEADMMKAITDKLASDTKSAKLGVPTPVDTLPVLPNILWPADRLALLRSDWMDPVSGKVRCRGIWQVAPDGASWTRERVTADMIVDRLAAGQVETAFLTAAFADVGYLKTRNFAGKKADGSATTDPSQAVSCNAGAALRETGYTSFMCDPRGFLLGKITLTEVVLRSLVGLASSPGSDSTYRVIYKGNNDPGVRNGAPNPAIIGLQVRDAYFDGTATHYRLGITMTPTREDDNMDAMRRIMVVFPTLSEYQVVGCPDRNYGGSTADILDVVGWVRGNYVSGPSLAVPTIQVVLQNCYGTATADFSKPVSGSVWTRGVVTTNASGSTGSGTSGSTSGGGRPGSTLLQEVAGL